MLEMGRRAAQPDTATGVPAMTDTDGHDDPAGLEPAPTSDAQEAVSTQELPDQAEPGLLPPFRVLLHNDDVNPFDHVILTICKLTPLSREEAIQRTWEAHTSGVALLLVTHKERAELIQEQFASCNLTVTIEPDSE
jgi:ATP-dependent Clp protease adaptor protein ClpS